MNMGCCEVKVLAFRRVSPIRQKISTQSQVTSPKWRSAAGRFSFKSTKMETLNEKLITLMRIALQPISA